MSAGKTVETMHFFICFTLRCFQFLKRLRSFLRQWICYHRPVLPAYWSPSTVSKRSSASLASKAPLTFPFGPRNANQQQQNCPNSPLQGRERGPTGFLKAIFDHPILTWDLVKNIPSRPLTNISKGPQYAVTRIFVNSIQADMNLSHCLSPYCFIDQVMTSCMRLVIK